MPNSPGRERARALLDAEAWRFFASRFRGKHYLYWLEDGAIHPIVPDAASPGATIRT
jgi:hypothetical protein